MKNITYLLLLLLSIGVCSCDDVLEKPPLDRIGNDAYWQTAIDLDNYVVQFYKELPSYGSGGFAGIFAKDASNSDNMLQASPSDMLNGIRAVPASGSGWDWKKIRDVNVFFQNYKKCEDPESSYSHFLGEAYFFKAWFYFEKVQTFGDVPWLSSVLTTDSEELYGKRDSRVVVVDSILNQLDKAILHLDALKDVRGGSNRLSKESALAFKSRVALFEGSWQKYHAGTGFGTVGVDPKKYFQIAVDAALELMNGNYKVGIFNNGIGDEDYGKLFGQDDYSSINEILLWKGYDQGLKLSHNAQGYLTSRTQNKNIALAMVESYLDKNGQPYDYRSIGASNKGNDYLMKIAEDCDPRLKQVVWIPGQLMWDNHLGKADFTKPYLDKTAELGNMTGFQLRKGVNPYSAGAGSAYGGASETGAIIFRYAEVLLNYAEAKYELDGNVDYDKSINLLRARAGMPPFQIITADAFRNNHSDYGYAISDELIEIRRERRVELACEGFREMDIKRWAAHNLFKGQRPKGYPYNAKEWKKKVKVPRDTDGFMDPYQKSLGDSGYGFREGTDYLNAIPSNEITLNPNLNQNPGWE